MSVLGFLNFVVLQWFGVRLARRFRVVPDIPPGEFADMLEGTLYRTFMKAYGADVVPGSLPKTYPMRRVRDGWTILRWIWPLTGWWSRYRWIAGRQ